MDSSVLFDTHAHLLDKRMQWLLEELETEAGGVICVFEPGEDRALFSDLLKRDNVWGAAGIHPHNASNYTQAEPQLREVLTEDGVVALGEIGLDFYYDNSPRDIQQDVFEKQLCLASELQLPVIIHTRESFDLTLDMISSSGLSKVLIHCFPGDRRQMHQCVEKGFYIAIGGIVTFSKAKILKDVAEAVPLDRLLLETDAPYLAPEPVRGSVNRPSNIMYIANEIASIKSMPAEDLLRHARDNAIGFFGLAGSGGPAFNKGVL